MTSTNLVDQVAKTRVGCKFCFRTLDAKDNCEEFRTFVKCSHCGITYHAVCWKRSEKCLRCGNNLCISIRVLPAPPLRIATKTRAVPIKPSSIILAEDGTILKRVGLLAFLHQSTHYSIQIGHAFILIALLLTIASFVGVFTYRIAQLSLINPQTIMNAIFREVLPSPHTVVGALMSGLVIAFIFYTRSSSKDSKQAAGGFTRFLAGIVTIAALDIILFDLNASDLVSLNVNLQPYEEILSAQGATALIALLLTPLYKHLAPIPIPPEISFPSWLTTLYGWLRFLFTSLLLAFFIVYLSTSSLLSRLNTPKLADISLGFTEIDLTLPMVGAFTASITVASILFWPPQFRQLKRRFGILRLLLVILCITAIGFMFRVPTNPQGYLDAIIIAFVATVVAVPVQRSLS